MSREFRARTTLPMESEGKIDGVVDEVTPVAAYAIVSIRLPRKEAVWSALRNHADCVRVSSNFEGELFSLVKNVNNKLPIV